MKIVMGESEKSFIGSINPGETFMFNGKVFMKISLKEDPKINAVELETGQGYGFGHSAEIMPVETEVLVKNPPSKL